MSIAQTGCNQEAGKYRYKLREVLRTMSRHWLNCADIWRRCWADITAAVLPCWVAEGQHFAKFACDSCTFWYLTETHCLRDGSGVRTEGSRHLHFSPTPPLSVAITCPFLNTVMALRGVEEHPSLRRHGVFQDDSCRKHLFCSDGSQKILFPLEFKIHQKHTKNLREKKESFGLALISDGLWINHWEMSCGF